MDPVIITVPSADVASTTSEDDIEFAIVAVLVSVPSAGVGVTVVVQ